MDLCDIKNIRGLLSKHGFHFSKSMGQNFLIEGWVPEQIAESAGLDANTAVLEIGPGIGCLTVQLAERAGRVVSVELDRSLEPVLSETLEHCSNVKLLYGDVLKTDIPALVGEHFDGLRPVVCANLPYNITSPLLTRLIESGCFHEMTVMVQREVARRICAAPGTADYSAFSVYMNWHTRPEILFDVPPHCFMPAPKVHSSVLHLEVSKAPPVTVHSERLFFRVVRACFAQRRKTLLNTLTAGFAQLSREAMGSILDECKIARNARGETLGIEEFARLSDVIFMRLSV